MTIEFGMDLVRSIAKSLWLRYRNLDFEELISAGNVGLMKGIRKYDESKGASIETHVRRTIRWEMLEYIKTMRTGYRVTGKWPTLVSWEDPEEYDRREVDRALAYVPEYSDVYEHEILHAALRKLSNHRLNVIVHQYWIDETLELTGTLMGITRERVRQIKKSAEVQLRELIRKEVKRKKVEAQLLSDRQRYVTGAYSQKSRR